MLYRKIRKDGDALSILGFGCMRLPVKKGASGFEKIDEERAQKQIRMAIDNGVNYFDTAYLYHMGASEPFLGKALSDGYRERVYLATKMPQWMVQAQADFEPILDNQLKKLTTDRIDYYLLHALNGKCWPRLLALGVIDFLNKAKAQGKIRYAGFSFHDDYPAFVDIVDGYAWDFCQIQYNFLDQHNQAGTKGLTYAASKGLGVVIMEPLRGGLLGKKPPESVQAIWQSAPVERSPAEWSLRWIWNHPEVTVVLSGMNEESHIQENIAIAGDSHPDSLTEKELETVRRVVRQYKALMKVGCTGCRYCMPCPSGVDISVCFDTYNHLHMYEDKKFAKGLYLIRVGGLLDNPGRAAQCVECGECLEKCPQQLPIPELLKAVRAEMEGRFFDVKLWLLRKFSTFQRWRELRQAKRRSP